MNLSVCFRHSGFMAGDLDSGSQVKRIKKPLLFISIVSIWYLFYDLEVFPF